MPTFFYVLTESLKEASIFYFQYWWFFTPIILWSIFEVAWVSYRQEKYLRNMDLSGVENGITMIQFISSIDQSY